MDGNLLEPLELDDTKIVGFIRDHKCGLCGSHLVTFPIKGKYHKYHAVCPEHGPATESSVVKTRTRDKVKREQRRATRELEHPEDQKKMTPDEIIKWLGF